MSKPTVVKTEVEQPKTETVADIVAQIADIVLAHRKDKPTLTAISRTTSRAAGLLPFKNREERTAAENAAAVMIARRSNLI